MPTMQAIRLTQPCSTAQMVPVTVARPTLKPGYVLIKIKAFGINPSEVISRRGQSDPDFSYPRILGIEASVWSRPPILAACLKSVSKWRP
ncbi:hypothetical protein [Lacticaseibacillus thailandensis]|uniref:hypothetical protein n=1 Tax=Lacticaseibacillus thailandensis TaxID=381741 RepID=UPI001CDAD523|nr:hypothetical protein [Lacticaseibacillus thailandensis]